MTRVDTDQVHVSINGGGNIVELSPGGTHIERRIATQHPGRTAAQPHAHWMSHDGHIMVTPNSNTNDSTRVDIPSGDIAEKTPTGFLPIASGMMPDASKYYVSNYVDSTITCISIGAPACRSGTRWWPPRPSTCSSAARRSPTTIPIGGAGLLDLRGSADPDTGEPQRQVRDHREHADRDDHHHRTATDELVKVLPCSAGCHGVNFGAKKGGGYYAYVSSKFSNDLIVVDPDPNDDGNVAMRRSWAASFSPSTRTRTCRPTTRDGACRHGRAGCAADSAGLQRLGPEAAQPWKKLLTDQAAESHQVSRR